MGKTFARFLIFGAAQSYKLAYVRESPPRICLGVYITPSQSRFEVYMEINKICIQQFFSLTSKTVLFPLITLSAYFLSFQLVN